MTNAAIPTITEEQKRAWRDREYDRVNYGHYTKLPAVWRDAYWFKYGVKTLDEAVAKERANGAAGKSWHAIHTDAHQNHFAHVSLVDGCMVAFTENDAKGVADRQTRMKPGKYLTKFFGDVLTAQEITEFATAFCAEFAPMELQFAKTADEIEHVYTHGPSSCMAYAASDYQSSCHPVRVYGDSDLQVAYIATGKDTIKARAIVWPAKLRYGRIYGDEGRLRPVLQAAGYKEGDMYGARIHAMPDGDDNLIMPYVDHISSARRDGKWLILGDGDICAQPTSGLTRNGPEYRCEDCGDGMDEDNAYSTDWADGYLCRHCYERQNFYCEIIGRDVHIDDTVTMANGATWSQRAFDRQGFVCDRNGENYPQDQAVEMADGETWSQDAFDAHGFTSDADGKHYPNAELVTLADGARWHQDHFDGFGTMIDGVPTRNPDAPGDALTYRCPDTLALPLSQPSAGIKAGDWVECLGNVRGEFTAGKLYQVSRVYCESESRLSVHADDNGDSNGWSTAQFRLAIRMTEAA